MMRFINPSAYLLVIGLVCQSLAASASESASVIPMTGKISVAGSDTLAQMVESWADRFSKQHPDVQFQLQAAGSSSAPIALIEGTSVLVTMSRKMTENEAGQFTELYGYAPLEIPVAVDALAFFVNKDNPLRGLSINQLDSIFSVTRRCGGVSNINDWAALVADRSYRQRRINLYGRNVVSGTYGFVKSKVLCNGDFKPKVNRLLGSSAVMKAVSEDPFAIGYSAIGFQIPDTKPLMIRDNQGQFIDASIVNAVSGRYPLSRYMYLYVNKPPLTALDPLHTAFIRYVLSAQGQTTVRQAGYIPLTEDIRTRYASKL